MVKIKKMEKKHLDQVFDIEKNCFVTPWSYNDLVNELEKKDTSIYIVAVNEVPCADSEEVIGYAGMWHVINEGHITNIAVKEECREKGIGAMIIKALIDEANALNMIGITLEVRMGNHKAQRLYTRFGFKVEGFRKRYYPDTKEDAVIMWKYLQ